MSQTSSNSHSPHHEGLAYAIMAFLAWGFLPLYWKALSTFPATELLLHRIFWCLGVMLLLINMQEQWTPLREAFRSKKIIGILSLTSLLIGGNWFIYIWAVNAGKVLETSLGYFINPLISVAFGLIFLKEKLKSYQLFALALALIGVLNLAIHFGEFPWIALSLAFSFACYGLLRKLVGVSGLVGLALETLILSPIAFLVIFFLETTGKGHFLSSDWTTILLLVGSGPATALPLLWFSLGVKKLPLSLVGLIQYLAPTCQFLLAVFLFNETFTRTHLISFSLIWCALGIYSFGLFGSMQNRKLRF